MRLSLYLGHKRGSLCQAFLAETKETGNKNRGVKKGNFHCMQMALVMSIRFIFGDD